MNSDWTWTQPLLTLWKKLARLVRHGKMLHRLLRIASADARGIGQTRRWFNPDTPVEGVLCWIDHQIATAPRPADPVFDQFVVRLIATEKDRAIRHHPIALDALPKEQVLLRWDGARTDWASSGRGTCGATVGPSHTGLLVIVWSMGVAYAKQQTAC